MNQSIPFGAIFMLIGFLLLTGGIWWIYRPAALIVAGLVLLGWGFFGRRLAGR
jgi:hypothetical protein